MKPPGPTALPFPQWVISDTHWGHANILKYCPWRQTWAKSIHHHDELLIQHWNDRVKPDDWALHLGDFALMPFEQVRALRSRLNGHIALVLGNHDLSATKMREAGIEVVVKHGFFMYGTHPIVCRHDPAKFTAEDAGSGLIPMLHGHWHGNQHHGTLNVPWANRLRDCGIDALQSTGPVPLQDALEVPRYSHLDTIDWAKENGVPFAGPNDKPKDEP